MDSENHNQTTEANREQCVYALLYLHNTGLLPEHVREVVRSLMLVKLLGAVYCKLGYYDRFTPSLMSDLFDANTLMCIHLSPPPPSVYGIDLPLSFFPSDVLRVARATVWDWLSSGGEPLNMFKRISVARDRPGNVTKLHITISSPQKSVQIPPIQTLLEKLSRVFTLDLVVDRGYSTVVDL